jgi:cysteine-rich repeat protein
VSGTCEATGWCSFPDPACDSGARYGDHAGGSLAGECVPPSDASTTDGESSVSATTIASTVVLDGSVDSGDATMSSSEASSDPTLADSSSTDAPPGVCGDGIVDAGEDCDDMNMIAGDGCTACVASGTVLWEIVEDGPTGLADGAASIDIDDADQLYVGAWFSNDFGPQLTARKYDLEGTLAWSTAIPELTPWDSVYAWGVAVDAEGNAVLAGDGTSVADTGNWIVAQVLATGDLGWQHVEPGRAFGIAIDGDIWACGVTAGAEARIVGYSSDGAELQRFEGNPEQPSDGSPWDIAVDDAGVIAVGEIVVDPSHGYVTRNSPDGAVLAFHELDPDFTQALALAHGPDGWWIVGSADPANGGWLARTTNDLSLVDGPDIVTPAAVSANLHGVAFGPDGQAVVVGWQQGPADYDALVQAYTPDGDVAWSRTYDGGEGKDDHARDVVIASDGTIVVAGHIGPLTDAGDFWLFALSP